MLVGDHHHSDWLSTSHRTRNVAGQARSRRPCPRLRDKARLQQKHWGRSTNAVRQLHRLTRATGRIVAANPAHSFCVFGFEDAELHHSHEYGL